MKEKSWLILIMFLHLTSIGLTASTTRHSNLVCGTPSGCPCRGETITCECTVAAGTVQAIVWSGSIFDVGEGSCNDIVVLRLDDRVPGECKGIVAYGYRAPDGHFISNMNLTATDSYNGRTIQCLIDRGRGETQLLIGNVTVNTSPEPTNPLESVRLLNATSRYLVFNWKKVSNCSLVQYVINASEECGICPNHTSSTQVKCFLSEGLTDKQRICRFKVITAICGGLHGLKSESNMVMINLKLPDTPMVKYESTFENGLLQSFALNITEKGAFTVSDDISGSALSYNISYSDITTGSMYLCDSTIIRISSCDNGACRHHFQVTSSSMPLCKRSKDIIVSVFATNVFGDGSKSIIHIFESQTPHIINQITENNKINVFTLVIVTTISLLLVFLLCLQLKRCSSIQNVIMHRINGDNNDDENQGGIELGVTSGGAVEPREYEEEAELSTTHAICLEVKQGDTTSSSGHSTTPMAQFAAKYLPGYRSEWQCGYYEFTKKKPESFTADQRILLMTVEKNCSLLSKDKRITKLVATTISSIVDNSDDLKNVHLNRIKKRCNFVFIKSRNDDYALSVGQKFLYCAHFTEVNGHVEQCDKEDSDKTVHEFASEKFKLLREGYAYREVRTEADLSLDKLFNKSVLLSKKSTTRPSPGETEVYRSTNLNAHLLLLHKFNKLPEQSTSILYSCTQPLDRFAPFIHTSGRKSKVSGRRILFCIQMNRIDKCSYCKVERVPKALPSHLYDPDTSMTKLMESDGDKAESQEISMAEFGQKFIGDQYDQQLGYGYHELEQGSTVRLKQFKKIVLRDKNKHLFTGTGAQRLIGLREDVQEFKVADLRGTHWTHVFVESRGKNRKLMPGSSFLFYVPLKKLDAYYEMYVIKNECQMSEFAKSKIPGFNPTRGYGYCEILQSTDDIIPQSTIILMNKNKELFSGPGAYYYVIDTKRFKELKHVFIQRNDVKLDPGTRFLYCEYS